MPFCGTALDRASCSTHAPKQVQVGAIAHFRRENCLGSLTCITPAALEKIAICIEAQDGLMQLLDVLRIDIDATARSFR